MSWTDERVDELRTLWKDGLSASQIAEMLGGVTRNGVIGKLHRLGLSGDMSNRGKGLRRSSAKQKAAPKPKSDISADQPKRCKAFYTRNPIRVAQIKKSRKAIAAEPAEVVVPKEGIPYGERKRHQCGEIVGRTGGDIRCCGKPVVDFRRETCAECSQLYSAGKAPRALSAPSERNYLPRNQVAPYEG